MTELEPDAAEIKAWLDETFPGLMAPIPDEVIDRITEQAHAEGWHPEALREALDACADEALDASDAAPA